MSRAKFIPFPPELQLTRIKMSIPGQPEKLISYGPIHKVIFLALFQIFNPLMEKPSRREVRYEDIYEITNIPIQTLKKHFPVLAYNFPKIIKKTARPMGKGYIFEFSYDFNMKSAGSIGNAERAAELEQFLCQIDEIDFEKWRIFERIKLENENKRLFTFQAFMKGDLKYWERNITWAIAEAKRLGWKEIPNGWIWKCLEKDYGYNKLSKKAKDAALKTAPGVLEVESRFGQSLSEMFIPGKVA